MGLHDINPHRRKGGNGFDGDDILVTTWQSAASSRRFRCDQTPKTMIEYDREVYKRRDLIEQCVNRLKQFRCTGPVTRKQPK